jgi:hypothetical protein
MFKLAIVAAAWWRANRFAQAAISEPDAYAFYHPGAYALSQGSVIRSFAQSVSHVFTLKSNR